MLSVIMSGSSNEPFESEVTNDAVQELAPVSGDLKVSFSVNSSLIGSDRVSMRAGEAVGDGGLAVDYSGSDEHRVLEDASKVNQSRACEIKIEKLRNTSDDDSQEAGTVDEPMVDRFGVQNASISRKENEEDYDTMLSMFDQFASNGKIESVGHGYEIGDMVWGKVKSHPWWPGQIFNEALASAAVRRSKSEGHVLVAFFGDSSYGWFDPAELVPFESYFAEKSKQTSSRTFVKAVEEGLEEVNRRQALGLVCQCRKQFNFRNTDAEGYLAVDIGDYETGVYSISQIRKAREGFQPEAMLKFIKQLAVAPMKDDLGTINLMKNKSTVSAFRKAVFEEFDETYAQAFGAQPVRSATKSAPREQSRVPLSGRLVFAETLGKGKSSLKSNKMKDDSELDKYVFKRRDEPDGSKSQIGQTASSSQPLQKMGSVVPSKGKPAISRMAEFPEQSDSHLDTPEELGQREPVQESGGSVVTKGKLAGVGSKPKKEGGKKKAKLVKRPAEELNIEGSVGVQSDSQLGTTELGQQEPTKGKLAAVGTKPKKSGKKKAKLVKRPAEELNIEGSVGEQSDSQLGTTELGQQEPTNGKLAAVGSKPKKEGGKKKAKLVKRPAEELIMEGSVPEQSEELGQREPVRDSVGGKLAGVGFKPKNEGGKKKAKLVKPAEDLNIEGLVPKIKKRKKLTGKERSSDNMPTPGTGGTGEAFGGRIEGKHDDVPSDSGDNPVTGQGSGNAEPVGENPAEVLVNNSDVKHVGTDDRVKAASSPDLDADTTVIVPELLSELRALALDPSASTGRNYPEKLVQVFSRFRSLVYLKSSSSGASAEGMSNEVHGMSVDNARPPKAPVRLDGPFKGGRKRGPSDRQEEMTLKKKKKISDMKSLALEKKTLQRAPEVGRDGKESSAKPTAQMPEKKVASKHQAVDARDMARKPTSSKAFGKAARATDPTILIMKFPADSALPSPAELKVKFARFGPLDHSGTRIFWKSSTIRLVYIYRNDAQAALKFATASSNLFGNTNVRCQLREVESSEPEPNIGIPSQTKDPPPPVLHQRPGQNLKSILKKPAGDEGGSGNGNGNGNGNSSKGRVKFMLGDEGTVKTSSDEGASSASLGSKNISEKIQMSIPPPLPMPSIIPPVSIPNLPIIAPSNYHQHAELVPPPPPPPPRNVHPSLSIPAAQPHSDISQQMISLLTKCKDVVSGLTGELGYVPYHSL